MTWGRKILAENQLPTQEEHFDGYFFHFNFPNSALISALMLVATNGAALNFMPATLCRDVIRTPLTGTFEGRSTT